MRPHFERLLMTRLTKALAATTALLLALAMSSMTALAHGDSDSEAELLDGAVAFHDGIASADAALRSMVASLGGDVAVEYESRQAVTTSDAGVDSDVELDPDGGLTLRCVGSDDEGQHSCDEMGDVLLGSGHFACEVLEDAVVCEHIAHDHE
jgi:hypothetical protein